MAVAAMAVATSVVLAKKKAVATRGSLKAPWHFQNPQRRKAMHRSLSKAKTPMRRKRNKAKAANLGSLVPATVMVVTVAIALTVLSKRRQTLSPKNHRLLQHLRQCQHRLQSVWPQPLPHLWPPRQRL